MYDVSVSDEAQKMFKAHLKFLSNVSIRATRKLKNEFQKVKNELAKNPLAYPLWQTEQKITKPYRRLIFGKRYLVIYAVEGKRVIVTYILDCRMNNVRLIL